MGHLLLYLVWDRGILAVKVGLGIGLIFQIFGQVTEMVWAPATGSPHTFLGRVSHFDSLDLSISLISRVY